MYRRYIHVIFFIYFFLRSSVSWIVYQLNHEQWALYSYSSLTVFPTPPTPIAIPMPLAKLFLCCLIPCTNILIFTVYIKMKKKKKVARAQASTPSFLRLSLRPSFSFIPFATHHHQPPSHRVRNPIVVCLAANRTLNIRGWNAIQPPATTLSPSVLFFFFATPRICHPHFQRENTSDQYWRVVLRKEFDSEISLRISQLSELNFFFSLSFFRIPLFPTHWILFMIISAYYL